nr:hypothetical transcript [Hymenolepis microstoma]
MRKNIIFLSFLIALVTGINWFSKTDSQKSQEEAKKVVREIIEALYEKLKTGAVQTRDLGSTLGEWQYNIVQKIDFALSGYRIPR